MRIERKKVWSSALAIAVPILVTAITIWSGFRSLSRTAQNEFARQAAQIVLNTGDPNEGLAKAKFLASLFGSELPPDFVQSFDNASKIVPTITGANPDDIKDLIKLLAEHPQQRSQILKDWKAFFPKELWVQNIQNIQ